MQKVEFSKAMKKTHTILIPTMLPIHFELIKSILNDEGYLVELLKNEHPNIIDEGLKNVHHDTCYPALLVIGQMIDALKSGKYDIHKVALAITQTGGGCRASNYIHLLRIALQQANFSHVPVISVNFAKLESNSGFALSLSFCYKALYAILYGDFLMWIYNQCIPYEAEKGSCKQLLNTWLTKLHTQFQSHQYRKLKKNYRAICKDFANLKKINKQCIRIGIVGEIYMKYAPLGNNNLEAFLIKEGCEPVLSNVLDFGLYCLENVKIDHLYYGRHRISHRFLRLLSIYIQHLQNKSIPVINKQNVFRIPETFKEVVANTKGFINRGIKMGEGWLLTSEMITLIKSDVTNIVSCQPFGCLPNHIVAKGMIRKIKDNYPLANIIALDFDPSATSVNQENRLKLMLSTAKFSKSE